jgi:copper chaperone
MGYIPWGRMELRIAIEGMHCGGCVTRVTNALKKNVGVEVVNVEVGSAAVRFDEDSVSKETVIESVNKIGFTAKEG